MRWAMILRMLVRGTRAPGNGADGAGRDAVTLGEGAASLRSAGRTNASRPHLAGCDPWLSIKDMRSCLVMRPPRPVPETCERLTPCSRAILRTSGEERASSSSPLFDTAGRDATGDGGGGATGPE